MAAGARRIVSGRPVNGCAELARAEAAGSEVGGRGACAEAQPAEARWPAASVRAGSVVLLAGGSGGRQVLEVVHHAGWWMQKAPGNGGAGLLGPGCGRRRVRQAGGCCGRSVGGRRLSST